MNRFSGKFSVSLFLFTCLLSPPLVEAQEKPKPVKITVTPRTCEPPCTISVAIVVEPHPDNRRVVLMWSDVHVANGRAGSEAVILDSTSPASFSWEIKEVSKGSYYFLALVYRGKSGKPHDEAEAWVFSGIEPYKE